MHVGRWAERTEESTEDSGPLMASCVHGHSCGQHGFRSPEELKTKCLMLYPQIRGPLCELFTDGTCGQSGTNQRPHYICLLGQREGEVIGYLV